MSSEVAKWASLLKCMSSFRNSSNGSNDPNDLATKLLDSFPNLRMKEFSSLGHETALILLREMFSALNLTLRADDAVALLYRKNNLDEDIEISPGQPSQVSIPSPVSVSRSQSRTSRSRLQSPPLSLSTSPPPPSFSAHSPSPPTSTQQSRSSSPQSSSRWEPLSNPVNPKIYQPTQSSFLQPPQSSFLQPPPKNLTSQPSSPSPTQSSLQPLVGASQSRSILRRRQNV